MANFFSSIFHRKERILPHFERVKLDKKKLLLNNLLGGVAWGVGSVTGATMILVILGLFITVTKSIPFIGDIVRIGINQIEDAKESAAFLTTSTTSSDSVENSSLKFLLEPRKSSYYATEFIELSGALYNVSFTKKTSFFNTCAEHLEIFLNKEKVTDLVRTCETKPYDIGSFDKVSRDFYLDGSSLPHGTYELQIVSDGVASNIVKLTIAAPEGIHSCGYETAFLSTQCEQLVIESIGQENCENIVTSLIDDLGLKLVHRLSTSDCTNAEKVRFVSNVPKNKKDALLAVAEHRAQKVGAHVSLGLENTFSLRTE